MKIHGPNQPNINAYKNQIQQHPAKKPAINREDQLQISSEAKKLLESEQPNAQRAARVDKLKEEVESGTYKIDHNKLAEKLFDLWTKQK